MYFDTFFEAMTRMGLCARVYMCVCGVCVRARERDRDRERQRERKTDKQTDRHRVVDFLKQCDIKVCILLLGYQPAST